MSISRKNILVVLSVFLFGTTQAQSFVENALRFGQSAPSGSARIQALAGSSVALGGDYSSSLTNPAGLGMYNHSEFTITPALGSFATTGDYLNNSDKDSKAAFNIPGLSWVYHQPGGEESGGYVGGTFAISLTRTNDYHFAGYYHGINNQSSILDYFADAAYGKTTDSFVEGGADYNDLLGLAYQAYLIGPISSFDENYPNGDITYIPTELHIPSQSEEILSKGASNQWNFSYGGNFADRLFFGASVGISSLRLKTEKDYREEFVSDTLNYMDLEEDFDIQGTGINATFGLIARPVNFIQIGASLTTPTFYSLTDNYYAAMTTDWNHFSYETLHDTTVLNHEYTTIDPNGVTSEYSLTIPLKFRAGVTLISKLGFLTAEAEFTNPARTRYSSETPGVSFHPENDAIAASFRPTTTLRVGAEARAGVFRFRAGVAKTTNAVKDAIGNDQSSVTASLGAGVRLKSFFIDFAAVGTQSKTIYSPYVFSDGYGPVVDFRKFNTNYLTTVGFVF